MKELFFDLWHDFFHVCYLFDRDRIMCSNSGHLFNLYSFIILRRLVKGIRTIGRMMCFGLFVFRMSHPGQGLPPDLIQDMVGGGQQWTSQEGLALNLSRRLLNKLNGSVLYVREQTKCYFLIDIELKLRRPRGSMEATTSQRT